LPTDPLSNLKFGPDASACYHSLTLHIDWRTALTYVGRQPAWTRRVGLGGALMLVLPPIGWLLALGYRSLVAARLADNSVPLLPEWRTHAGTAFRRGVASCAVILTYLAPSFVAYWLAGVRHAGVFLEHWRELAVFAAAVIVFPPLCIPTLPVLYAVRYDWLEFTPVESVALLALALGTIAVLPAAFLQVAKQGTFRAAFQVGAALRHIVAVPRLYAEAWVVSLAVSAAAVAVVPLTPWLLFWSYLTISHLFLQTLGVVRRASTGTAAAVAAV
jgi:hypothetical protein